MMQRRIRVSFPRILGRAQALGNHGLSLKDAVDRATFLSPRSGRIDVYFRKLWIAVACVQRTTFP